MNRADLQARFRGCLLGLAVGDALGARFEAQSAEHIRRRYPTPVSLVSNLPTKLIRYTDDTQMAIAVAEALVENDLPTTPDYAAVFVSSYQPWRGYGRGARSVLEKIENGMEPEKAAVSYFPEGSYGNGAAMRVAPVGLRFHRDPETLADQARVSSAPTHAHPLGVEGAVLLARAVGRLTDTSEFDREVFFGAILDTPTIEPFTSKLHRARSIAIEDVGELGNGIEALESVPTALACFACWPHSFVDAVGSAILLGGDTDTIAAMTGALSGAYLGIGAIPREWLGALENDAEVKGRSYIRSLADSLFEVRQREAVSE